MNTVLIIDDDPIYRKFMGEIIEQKGWQVLLAEEGEAGIQLARAHRPAAVLCDLLMPRCNGFQVCRALRSDPALRAIRLIVSSGRQFESDRQAAFAAGADEFVSKPIPMDQLADLLARAASKGGSQVEPAASKPATDSGTRVTFWGVRGSIPTPGPSTVRYGGNTSCIEVRAAGQIIILVHPGRA